jgi:hypothetical protein
MEIMQLDICGHFILGITRNNSDYQEHDLLLG